MNSMNFFKRKVKEPQPETISEVTVPEENPVQEASFDEMPEAESEVMPEAESEEMPEAESALIQEMEPEVLAEKTEEPAKKGFFQRLKDGLSKTRNNIVAGIDSVFSGFSPIEDYDLGR